jgi:Cdc6-like AAA superfamily ATPase
VSLTETLPGREDHLETIRSFLKARVNDDDGPGAIYISGAPGTGKTASVTLTLSLPKVII